VHSEESLKILEGDSPNFACKKDGKQIVCVLELASGEPGLKGNFVKFKIFIDSPPELHFASPHYSDYIAVDIVEHSAVIITRLVGENYLASKVCHGTYVTQFEMNNIFDKGCPTARLLQPNKSRCGWAASRNCSGI
jgi:hypothetical protein